MDDRQRMKILVVDDEKDIRDGCVRVLRRLDCDVSMAANGHEALDLLGREFFNVVLLDLKMPGIDGMDVLREIQQQERDILVIVITGFATVETAIEAMKQGAYDFIPKPFDPAQLRIVVERALDKIRLIHETEQLALERSRTLADLGTEKSRISAIVESLPTGVAVTDKNGTVVLMNPSFKLLTGLAPETAPGADIATYIEDPVLCDMVRRTARGDNGGADLFTHELSIGKEKYLIARGRPVQAETGECIGTVVTLGDITSIKLLDQLKSEFVAKVPHELRSPLSTIHEQLGAVLRDMAEENDDNEDQYILSRAKEKTGGLIALIGDLLDLSRIESGGVMHNIQPVRLENLLSSIVDFMQSRAASKELTLSLELGTGPFPELTADPLALESIFGNLVANALQYTGTGGSVVVRADMEEGFFRVSVTDTGFGIAEQYREKIFEKFFRVKDENTRFITGTGLGLPIVKGLVEQMGGTIELASQPGKGSTFTVRLPASRNV
ncbi:MAG: response regulator [Thermodesulfobacteriota bacterium]|nr:response regulator [Thermodesulfobacteriota bacterium]